ncbi:ovostatin [Xenopus tropicalis]|uniref:Ovostatin n=3 Tax=Xenopus tropicalis TaxID=8364 RepID=A0A8J1JX60_XENTR|nr:ovostatin [Xenopus tropicalis]
MTVYKYMWHRSKESVAQEPAETGTMFQQRLLACVCLLGLISGAISKPRYALSVPAVLKSGENSTACINILDNDSPLQLNVNLEFYGANYSIFSETVQEKTIFKCKEFTVPAVSMTVPVFITMVATGPRDTIMERRSAVIGKMENINFVQLDKSIYKAGQKVQCRLISLNPLLRPVQETYTAIYILDPLGSRIFQWLNKTSRQGLVALEYLLLSDATLGTYNIVAERISGPAVSQPFEVAEYALPRYSVTVAAPNTISIQDQNITFQVNAKYTYGQGVPGKLSGRLCRKYNYYYPGMSCNRKPEGLCQNIAGDVDPSGTFNYTADLALFQLERGGLDMVLSYQITLTENGTGVQVTESGSVSISNLIARVSFDYQAIQPYYKPGIPYRVAMTLVNAAGNPLSNETIELRVSGNNVQNLTTDRNGKVRYELDVSGYEQPQLDLQAIYKNAETCYDPNWVMPIYSNDVYTVTRFFSRTGSYVEISAPQQELSCGNSYTIKAHYSLSPKALGNVTNVSFYYLVMSKTKIVKSGEHLVALNSRPQRGTFSLNLTVSQELAPGFDVIVYSMLQSEVIAHKIHLNTEKCFEHQVSLSFSASQGTPGSNVNLTLRADPRSLCGLLAIDSSLILLGPGTQLTAERVYNALQYLSLNGYSVGEYNVEPAAPPCIDSENRVLDDGLVYQPVQFPGQGNTYNEFKSAGLHFATNSSIYKPELCGFYGYTLGFFHSNMATPLSATLPVSVSVPGEPISTVRKSFPEVWNFDIVAVGDTGSASPALKAPDTITQWQASMFCLSEGKGLGVTKYPSNFTSSLPFFVEVSVPFSFTRGEMLLLRAFVSNYLNQCIKVRVTLQPSKDYTAVLQEGTQDMCVCPKGRASYSWNVTANSLGVISFNVTAQTTFIGATCGGPPNTTQPPRSDTVIKTVIVEAEGIEKEVTYSNLVCVEGNNAQIPFSITPPANMVKGSAKASVTVIGDPLGHAVNNPDSLIQMPTGCGEQNLVKLLPIPAVLAYLNCSGQLTKEIQDKAVQYMATGYVRQLGFKRYDGTFSAFGQRDPEGSSWLTALSLYTFQKIKQYTLVDPTVINQGLVALEKSQDLQSGCFKVSGTLFNSELKGGAENEISFTAYVVAILMETNYPGAQTLLRNGLGCLDAASRREQTLYNLALLFYAFSLSGNEERRNATLAKLKKLAIHENGGIHWEQTDKPIAEKYPFFYAPPPSADIEITGYVLLGFTKGPAPSQEEKSYMTQIAVWLVRQQNSQGGFRSTADTVVALQALAEYSCLVYKKGATNRVTVSLARQVIATFNVQPSNRLLVQRRMLPSQQGNYSFGVSGNGCCLIQSTVKYNVPVVRKNSTFSLSVNTSSGSCINGAAFIIPINLTLSYNGRKNQSNMAVVDMKLLSGYSVQYQSLLQLRQQVPKVEQINNHLIIYLSSVQREPISLPVSLEMGNRVQNFQPQSIYVYDYYDQDENAVVEVRHPCSH